MLTAKIDKMVEGRLTAGMNKTDLAKACKVSHSIIVRVEQGAGTSPRTAKAISEALNKPVLELFEIRREVGV